MAPKFEIEESSSLSFREIKLLNKITGDYFTVLPELGGRLNELVLNKNKKLYPVLRKLVSDDMECRDNLFNHAKLFPFANRIKEGKYSYEGKEYQLKINYPEENNSCHGFVYDKKFKIVDSEINDSYGKVSLSYDYPGNIDGYPFLFSLSLVYKLSSDGKMECETTIENKSGSDMPFSDGWHHYFTLGESIDELALGLEAETFKKLNQSGIPNGKDIILKEDELEFKLGNKKLDTIYTLQNKSKNVTKLFCGKRKICLNVWQENSSKKYKFLNIYTPENRNSIAIEPMTSNIDAFNNCEGLIFLAPSSRWSGLIGIYLD